MVDPTENTINLKEGDLVLFRGPRLVSHVISFMSNNFSHCAIVLKINGQFCFCHSTPNPAFVPSVDGIAYSGVIATRVEDSIQSGFYTRAHVYRFPRVTDSKLRAMKTVFAYAQGSQYEQSPAVFCCSALKCASIKTLDSYTCSELCGKMLYEAQLITLKTESDIHKLLPIDLISDQALHIGHMRLPKLKKRWFWNFSRAPSFVK